MQTSLVCSCVSRVNNHLRKKGYEQIQNLTTDFETGVKLMEIINALYDLPIPKHNKVPKVWVL